jgi:lysine-N-methylase
MEMIEHYQPEYVTRFAAGSPCTCPACQKAKPGWPRVNIALKNQQRDSLDMACESAAKAILLDPEAFVLNASQSEAQGEQLLSPWKEMLNQQCINLAVHPAMPLDVSLYAIGVLLSKAMHYKAIGESDPALLALMGDQLSQLAEHGVLEQQFAALPPIMPNRLKALKEMGQMRLNLNLPMAEKMGVMLKLSELSIMQPARLEERLTMLEQSWLQLSLFSEQPQILRNFLIYKLYHDVFPGIHCADYGAAFLALSTAFFRLRMLCALGETDRGELNQERALALISACSGWEQLHPLCTDENDTADYNLLCGLSLL